MSPALIEIAVPTYNGSRTIAEAIKSLLVFVGSSPVRIRVYDNASTDQTIKVVNGLNQLDGRVSILTFNENLGFDGNVRRCISHADADYVWLFSDDDVAPVSGFDKLLAYLDVDRPNILYLNHFAFYNDDVGRRGASRFEGRDHRYARGLDFFYKCDLGFISSQVLERSLAQVCERAMQDSSGHAHLEIAARIALKQPGPFFLMGSCVIGARTLELPRYNSVKQGFIAKALLFKRLRDEALFSESEFQVFIKQLVSSYFVYTVLKDRAYKVTPPKALRKTLADFSGLGALSGRYFFISRIAAWFPSVIAMFIVKAYYWKRSLHVKDSK